MSSRSHPFVILAAIMLCTVMLPVLLIGTVGVVHDDGPMRPVFGMMAVGALLGIGGAARNVWQAVQSARSEGARLATARRGEAEAAFVARWPIEMNNNRAFADREWAARRQEVLTTAGFVFVLGAGLLWLTEDGPVWAAFAASGFLSSLYIGIGLGKYALEHQASTRSGTSDVVILQDAVVVCGTWHALAGDRELLGVRLADDALEFTVRWDTRGGPTEDTIRVPVPQERRAEAEEVVRFFAER
ncbi:MAG: hypothetical protein Q8P18_28665 [Pseudomonadota bacterium]|nr:hypothetical protein [Pseudomonadota bacterium]